MGLVLACVVRILCGDRSIKLGENRSDRFLKRLLAILSSNVTYFNPFVVASLLHQRDFQCVSLIGSNNFCKSIVCRCDFLYMKPKPPVVMFLSRI